MNRDEMMGLDRMLEEHKKAFVKKAKAIHLNKKSYEALLSACRGTQSDAQIVMSFRGLPVIVDLPDDHPTGLHLERAGKPDGAV